MSTGKRSHETSVHVWTNLTSYRAFPKLLSLIYVYIKAELIDSSTGDIILRKTVQYGASWSQLYPRFRLLISLMVGIIL